MASTEIPNDNPNWKAPRISTEEYLGNRTVLTGDEIARVEQTGDVQRPASERTEEELEHLGRS